MNVEEILALEIGTKILYTHENVTEERVIGKVLGKLAAISSYGMYMPLNNRTYKKYHYKIEKRS